MDITFWFSFSNGFTPLWKVNRESSLTMVNHGQNMVDYVVCSGFDSGQLWPWLTMIWFWSDCVKHIVFSRPWTTVNQTTFNSFDDEYCIVTLKCMSLTLNAIIKLSMQLSMQLRTLYVLFMTDNDSWSCAYVRPWFKVNSYF